VACDFSIGDWLMDLRGKSILVTGAAGFIGGRLAGRLRAEEGAAVRGLVRNGTRNPQHVSEIAIGDVVDVDAIRRAVDGCAIVIHCAAMQSGRARLDAYRRVNVGGTLNLLRAAREANAARFIHISTINAHGVPPPHDAHADSPLCFRGDHYSVSKAEGERAAWQFARENKIALTVIRPACTYGPRSNAWTVTPLRRVKRGRPVLIGGGDGICNAVYVDNLVDLIVLALKNDAAVGQAFIGAEGRGVTWRKFYGAYAQILDGRGLFGMPRLVARALTMPFEMLARIDGYPPRLARASVEFYSHRVVFDIEKSQRLLGYAPRVSFEEGMARTRQWLADSGWLAVDQCASRTVGQ
jgi:nucleoside-diphosphate-sugar epimerase